MINFAHFSQFSTDFESKFRRFYHQITDLEPNAFEGKTSSLPDLRRYFLPLANINEFLIEKSPQYARGHIHEISNRAKSMYEANPNMKLFAFVTDPVERLFSHINHCIKKKWPFCQTRFQISALIASAT